MVQLQNQDFQGNKKYIYYGSRCYLPRNHPYRKVQVDFNGGIKLRAAPVRVTATDIIQWGTK